MLIVTAQLIDDRLDAPYDENGLSAPYHLQHLAGFEFRSIDVDRSTKRFGARAGLPGSEEWNRGKRNADGARADRCCRQQAAAAVVNLVTHAIVPRNC